MEVDCIHKLWKSKLPFMSLISLMTLMSLMSLMSMISYPMFVSLDQMSPMLEEGVP